MSKRPKDMTREELEALPVKDVWSEPLHLGYNGDDIMFFRDRMGLSWVLYHGQDGEWYRSGQ